jgi:hypothetical protein
MPKTTSILSSEEGLVLRRLQSWHDEIDELMRDLERMQFGGRGLLQARARYREIKERMRAEYKLVSTIRGRAELNGAERRWYERPITHAAVHLRAPVNGSGRTIFHSLFVARSDISLAIHRMNDSAAKRPKRRVTR